MSTLTEATVAGLLNQPPFRILPAGKQLTLAFGGIYIASTTVSAKSLLVWETEKSYPRYYIPIDSLHEEVRPHMGKPLERGGITISEKAWIVDTSALIKSQNNDFEGVIDHFRIGEREMKWVRFLEGPLKGYIRFEKSEMDDWFENGSLFISIKNPYKRIDTASVSRHIVIKVDGEVVAETNVAVSLTETGLSETYYIPATSVKNWAAVEKSDLRTACPYKGEAWYLNLTVQGKKHENLIWYYPYPTHESAAVAGLISFYRKDFVDVVVDGVTI